jgi:biopolymer transport protein ExbB/TolQ
MSSSTPGTSRGKDPAPIGGNWGPQAVRSPWLWAPLATVAFYLAIPHLPTHSELLTRYFCGHWIQYAETGIGFLGLAILLRRLLDFFQESRALRLVAIDSRSLEGLGSATERAQALLLATSDVPSGISRTRLVLRIRATCEYVTHRGPRAAVDEHLRYLADLAVENLKTGFAPLRTIIWTAPVLGILGTVLRMALAFHSVDPDNLDLSMPEAMAGLEGSLDAMVLGVSISIVLLFGKLFVERCESHALEQIEHFGMSQLACCLASEEAEESLTPLAKAETEAAAHLLERTDTLIARQTEIWQEALEDSRRRWLDAARDQQARFAGALEQGMVAGLASHSQQLEEARGEFLKAFRAVGLELARVTAGLQQMGEEHQELFRKEVTQTWQAMQAQVTAARGEHQEHMTGAVALLENSVRGWHDDLTRATSAITAQIEELQRCSAALHTVAGNEESLIRLQTTLTHNLQSVRAMETFQESIHSLNAAVHLLTMRTKAHAA